MSQVSKEAPPRRTSGTAEWDDLAYAALAERGEWFSTPRRGKTPSNAHAQARRAVGQLFADITVNGDKVYLRIRPDSEVSA